MGILYKHKPSDEWSKIIDYLKSGECKHLERYVDQREGWGYIFDRQHYKHHISMNHTLEYVQKIVEHINRT